MAHHYAMSKRLRVQPVCDSARANASVLGVCPSLSGAFVSVAIVVVSCNALMLFLATNSVE